MIKTIPTNEITPGTLLQHTPSKAVPEPDRRYNIFVVLWSIAALFHMAQSRTFSYGLHFAILTIAAAVLIGKPSSVSRFLIFLAVQLSVSLRVFPYVSNHEIFVLFADLSILHALLFYVFKNRTFNINKADLFNTFAPILRAELIILYFFVVFHKLNTSFFNTDVSCASDFINAQLSTVFKSPTILLALTAYLTLIIEALIPLFLCFRKTRNMGLLIGLIFHWIIAYNPINGFYDFSSAIFACYFLFASPELADTAVRVFNSFKTRAINIQAQPYSHQRLLFFTLTFLGVILVIYGVSKKVEDYFRFVFWTVFSLLCIWIFIRSLALKKANHSGGFRVAHWSLLILPVIVFINGLCPYLGLKTESSFAMFSNLRTEGGISNHLIVPASIQIFDFQKDLVEVTSSSAKELQELADRKQLIPFFQFKELVSTSQPKQLEYIRGGKNHNFNTASVSEKNELLQGNPFLLKKVLRFRAISKYEPQPCSH